MGTLMKIGLRAKRNFPKPKKKDGTSSVWIAGVVLAELWVGFLYRNF